MGQHLAATLFTASDQARYRHRIHRCLEAFGRMVTEGRFAADEPSTGVEIELALVDEDMRPAMLNHAVLDRSASDVLTSELGRWNLEINLPPRMLPGATARDLEKDMLDAVSSAGECARGVGASAVTIGILPTLGAEHLASDQLTEDPRYALLNRQMLTARGEPFRLDITEPPAARGGPSDGSPAEHLVLDVDSIAPEAACTSLQLHLQLTPETFPAYWNAAQAVAGLQVALAANSPFLLGRRLWAETRVPLFTQAVDTRPVELRNQGVRPRVWFGDRWAQSAYDLFEENVRYFGALLPLAEDEDPFDELDAGRAPSLHELRLHNGTVWRWNRPVYDVADGVAHLRLENRVLPAGPTAVDAVANAMFFYGLIRALAESDRPPWQQMSFDAAEANFTAGARHGIDAALYWPGIGTVRADELALRRMLPLAQEGLAAWGVDGSEADRYLVGDRAALRAPVHGRRLADPGRERGRAPRRRPPDRDPAHDARLPRGHGGQRARAHLAGDSSRASGFRPGPVEHHPAEGAGPAGHGVHVGEAGVAQHRRDVVGADEVRRAVPVPVPVALAVVVAREPAQDPGVGAVGVDEVQAPAGRQHPPGLREHRPLLLRRQVVEHERREHAVDGAVGVRELVGVAALQAQGDAEPRGLAAGEVEHRRVGVEADERRPGRDAGGQQQHLAGAGAELQHRLPGRDPGLRDELPVDRARPQDAGEHVVGGGGRAEAHRRQERALAGGRGLGHDGLRQGHGDGLPGTSPPCGRTHLRTRDEAWAGRDDPRFPWWASRGSRAPRRWRWSAGPTRRPGARRWSAGPTPTTSSCCSTWSAAGDRCGSTTGSGSSRTATSW